MNLFVHCPKCSYTQNPAYWKNGPHIELKCWHCGSHIKFISKEHVPEGTTIKGIQKPLY